MIGQRYIVVLETGLWICNGSRPTPTMYQKFARHFESEKQAERVLDKMRRNGKEKYENAVIEPVKV